MIATNAAHALAVELADGALRVRPQVGNRWEIELRWTGVGRGAESTAPASAEWGEARLEGNRASYRRADGSEEWYVNGPLGIGRYLPERSV